MVSETYVIRSFRVTNNTGNTPTITIKNNAFNIVNAQTLSASASTEILTLPLVVEGGKLLKVTMSSTDSVTIGISYLNIKKESFVLTEYFEKYRNYLKKPSKEKKNYTKLFIILEKFFKNQIHLEKV